MAEGGSDWDEDGLLSALSNIRRLTLTDSETGEREVITVSAPVRNQETGEPEAFSRWMRPGKLLLNNRGCWGNSWSGPRIGVSSAASAAGTCIDEETGEPFIQETLPIAQPRSSFQVPRHMLLGVQPMISEAIVTEAVSSTSTVVASVPSSGFLPSFCHNRKRALRTKSESEQEETASTVTTSSSASSGRFRFCKLPRFRERAQHVAWALLILLLLLVISTFGFLLTCVICTHLHRHYSHHSEEDTAEGRKAKRSDQCHKYAQCFWYGHMCRVCREEAAARRFTRLHFRDAEPSAGVSYKANLLGAKHFTCCG